MTSNATPVQHQFSGAEPSEIEIDPSANPWLLDHTVRGVAVVPGAIFVEALAAEYVAESTFALTEVQFHALTPLTSRSVSFSTAQDGASLVVHHQGRQAGGAPVATAVISTDLSCPDPIGPPNGDELTKLSGEAAYKQLASAGNDYGPQFRCLTEISRASSASWGSWSVAGESEADYKVHPLLVDVAMHALGLNASDQNSRYLLNRIGRVVVTGTPVASTGGELPFYQVEDRAM